MGVCASRRFSLSRLLQLHRTRSDALNADSTFIYLFQRARIADVFSAAELMVARLEASHPVCFTCPMLWVKDSARLHDISDTSGPQDVDATSVEAVWRRRHGVTKPV